MQKSSLKIYYCHKKGTPLSYENFDLLVRCIDEPNFHHHFKEIYGVDYCFHKATGIFTMGWDDEEVEITDKIFKGNIVKYKKIHDEPNLTIYERI